MISTKEAAVLFQKSQETIRNWSREFETYLDPKANPGKGNTRSFTEEDLQVLALIAKMKDDGFTYEDIHNSLKNGDRGIPPEINPQELRELLTTDTERRLILQIENLQNEVSRLTAERDHALEKAEEADELKVEVGKLRREVEILNDLLDRERGNDQSDLINQLYQQIGELKGEIKYLQRQVGDD